MKVLVLGGTRLSGVHLVNALLEGGCDVTIATRGRTKDSFYDKVSRLIVDRNDDLALKECFLGKHYDCVVDNLAYSSNNVRALFGSLSMDRYIQTSSVSVYYNLHMNLLESEVDTAKMKLRWGNYEDFDYPEAKRQAEAALFQCASMPRAAVRFPWIFGTDDYTKRLFFYFDCVQKGIPMQINNLNERLSFISSFDAGRFLSWCALGNIEGALNAASYGTISLRQIIDYIQKVLNKEALLESDGQPAPLNSSEGFSLDLSRAEKGGYRFQSLDDWLYKTIDFWAQN